jgi:hypothetical protein
VISAHARFISAIPILLLGWVYACYGPSAFYLADVRVKTPYLFQNASEAQEKQKSVWQIKCTQ